MQVYDQTAAQAAVKRFPVSFVRVADNFPATATDKSSLARALSELFVNGNTGVVVSHPAEPL